MLDLVSARPPSGPEIPKQSQSLKFPNAVVLSVVGRRLCAETRKKNANEGRKVQLQERKRVQKSAKERFSVKLANSQV